MGHAAMSKIITNLDELLLRQIHPNYLVNNIPSSDRFRPSKLDENKLSVDRESVHDAQASHALYTSGGKKSAAIFGVSLPEFNAESIQCIEDPTPAVPAVGTTPARPANPAHSLADYSQFDEGQQKILSRRLQGLAITRGKLFP
jgi:hypothetical protein